MEVLDIFHLEGMLEALEQKKLAFSLQNFAWIFGIQKHASLPLECFMDFWSSNGIHIQAWSKANFFPSTYSFSLMELQAWSCNVKFIQDWLKATILALGLFFTHGSPMARRRTFCITYGAPYLSLSKTLKLLIVFGFLLKFIS
jgi:hypothetical protein